VLEYSAGLAADWLAVFTRDSPASLTGPTAPAAGEEVFALTSCHASLLHGTYDQGAHPSVALAPARPADGAPMAFLEVHEGLPDRGDAGETTAAAATAAERSWAGAALNKCGTPIAHDGLVLDSFQVVAWVDTLRAHAAARASGHHP
jgi:hypothetical protein